ncbi:hypothetical protein MMC18_008931 [Xylographa bjoerkii]|nr:hypothetical protein [Xylographa bjoerkii]
MLPEELAGSLSLNVDIKSTKVARLLGRWKGQPDEQAASTYSSEPVYQSEHSSIDGAVDHDVKDTVHADIDDDDNELRKFYEPIATYEGRHRYDPKAQWTSQEEKANKLQLDYKICVWVCFMFSALQLDRGNISQALSDNMLDDLHMTINDYNNGMNIFYVSFLLAELPSQLISKKLGPDIWIPIQMVCWFYLPPLPTQTASKFRGRDGWFSEREEVIMVNRILRDDPSKGDMHNRQAVTPRILWEDLKDYDMWPIYLLGLSWNIPATPATNYLTLVPRFRHFHHQPSHYS